MTVVIDSSIAGLSYDASNNSAITINWTATGSVSIYRAVGDFVESKTAIEAAALTSTFLTEYPAFTKIATSTQSMYVDKDVLPGVGSAGVGDTEYTDDRTYTYVIVDSTTPANAQLFKVVFAWNSKALVQNFDTTAINALKVKSQNATSPTSFKIALPAGYNYIVAISSETDISANVVGVVEDNLVGAKAVVVADGNVEDIAGHAPVLGGTWQLKYQTN